MSPSTKPPILVGRNSEKAELRHTLDSGRPELVAVYGRRRIGKTFLIRTFFAEQLCFTLVGVRKATQKQQLQSFAFTLEKATGYKHPAPPDWPEAFQQLTRYLEEQLRDGKRKVVFFDELPWLAGKRSGFLTAFEHFWNSWGATQNPLIVVICGSAASWMITKVLHQKGGLHNRVTRNLPLRPFQLYEIETFLRARGIELDRKQLLELTMAVGGVPYYLDYVRKGRSAAQNIDALFFAPDAPLHDEFDKLFAALFDHHERHLRVINALARKQSGMNRQELVHAARLPSGGSMSTILKELETSGFIGRIIPFGRTARDALYRLIDEFTLFHLRWIEGKRSSLGRTGYWMNIRSTPAWHAWSGYAFENLCLTHVTQIKNALGIAGVQTEASTWRHRPANQDDKGAQIDLLIDRADGVINICEMKFCENPYVIDKKYARELRIKLQTFRRITGTHKALFLTFVTTYGVANNEFQIELVQNDVQSDELFES